MVLLLLAVIQIFAQDLPVAENIRAVKAPYDGFRPRAEVGADGTVHVVQMIQGRRGDLFYTRKKAGGEEWSEPLPINRVKGAVAQFAFAVGKGGRIHVMFRPTPAYLKAKEPEKETFAFADLKYMLVARLNDEGTAFEDPVDISGESFGLEGVGTILPDGNGTVRAFWHGKRSAEPGEENREILRAISTDEGKTWSKPKAVRVDTVGACACCPLAGHVAADGTIRLAFRDARFARSTFTKDAWILTSRDGGETFEKAMLGEWPDAGCPASIFSIGGGKDGPFVAWRTKRKIYFSRADREITPFSPVTGRSPTRAPFLCGGTGNTTLLLWGVTGGKYRNGSSLIVYQLYDKDGKAISRKGVIAHGGAEGWGSATAYPTPDGGFVILYDGPGPDR